MLEGILASLSLGEVPPDTGASEGDGGGDSGASEMPSLNAGAHASRDTGDGLPPLNAGAKGNSSQSVAPAKPSPSQIPEADDSADTVPDETQPQPTPDEYKDSPILQSLLEDAEMLETPPDGTEQIPPEYLAEAQRMFDALLQQHQQQQAQPQAQPEPADANTPPPVFQLTDEDFSNAFDSKDGMEQVLGKVYAHAVAQQQAQAEQMQKLVDHTYVMAMNNAEQMVYLAAAMREHPELNGHERQMRIAMNMTRQTHPHDLYAQVDEAVKLAKKDLATFNKVRNTKRVDVRGQQNAPKGAGSSSRGLHRQPAQPDDPGGLSFLLGRR